MVAGPGVTVLQPTLAWAQGEEGKDGKDAKAAQKSTLMQATELWEQAMLTEAAPLYEKALKEGGLFPSDVVLAYSRIGTVQALLKQKDAALSSFRVAALINPSFELPSESGKLAKDLYEKSRKEAAKLGGKLEVTVEAPERVDASKPFQVTAKLDEAFAPVVEKIGIEVKDTMAKTKEWKADQPSTASVTFDVPGKVVPGSTTLLVRVAALDQNGNRWAMQEVRVKVREAKVVEGPVEPPPEEKKSKGFFSKPWPYAIGGALLLGGVVAFFALRSPSEVPVGAPTWKLQAIMANQRPTATTQSLSLDSYTGPDGKRVTATYGTFFLGRYRVVDEIGVGGMASVHLARLDGAGGFQKWVAIKRIHPHLVEDDQFVHMFLDEARIAARINHANVAQVTELGEGEGNYWIAMEYLHGEPLREVMRSIEEGAPAMPYEVAAKIIADAAEGLHAAHELRGKNGEPMGLVHRDVTPHNIFVTYEGHVKVVDFGIAKVAGRLSSTRAGTLKGKLAYMSPEQVRGNDIDRRTDIFALGVVLWELTTNQRLFRTDSDLETLEKVQACQVPRPSQLRRDYPPQLEQIILKALARDPSQRFQTARDLSRELQKFMVARGQLVGPEHVSDYTHRIFGDRIRKRDEHLRWAAEVTQTINIDEFQRQQGVVDPSEISMVSQNSEIMPARAARGPQALPGPAPVPRSIEAGLPLPSIPTGPLPSPAPLPAPSMRHPLGGQPSPLPSFGGAPPPVPPVPPAHNAYDDEEDDNIKTIVAPARSLLIDDSMPTVALAHQPGAFVRSPLPAAGAPYQPPPVDQAGPPPVPTPPPVVGYPAPQPPPVNTHPAPQPPQVNSYPAPAAQNNGHPAPTPAPYPAPQPAISESPTFIPTPAANLASPPELSPAQVQNLQRDPTVQLMAHQQKKQMGLLVLASVAGTLLLVGVLALVFLKNDGKKEKDSDATAAQPTAAASSTAPAPTPTPPVQDTVVVVQPNPPKDSEGEGGKKDPPPKTKETPAPKPKAVDPPSPSPVPQPPPQPPVPQPTTPPSGGGNGFLTVVCSPACDSVVVKGRNLGPSPVMKAPFPAGTYPVVLKRNGSPPKATSVTITADKTTPLRMSM
jgi:serine/threonine-protein kinase